jgi:tRNA threonylcarbamoyladenosine biosynthesis protein TsaB
MVCILSRQSKTLQSCGQGPPERAARLPNTIISHVHILALETSSSAGSAALCDGDRVVGEIMLPAPSRSAQSLAPAVQRVLAEANWRPHDIQLVAVTLGPGSFTGLRVGAATAKTFAYAVGAEILGVNTLEAIAVQSPPDCNEVWTLLDAHRGQLYAARYRRVDEQTWQVVVPTQILDIDRWLSQYDGAIAASGPLLARLQERLPAGARVLDAECWTPRASTVGSVAYRHYQAGERGDVWRFAPEYYRPSAAEEKAAMNRRTPKS